MARLGVSKKKKSPRATELSKLKKELQRVTEQLEFRDRELEQRNAELSEALEQQTATSENLGLNCQLADRYPTRAGRSGKKCCSRLRR